MGSRDGYFYVFPLKGNYNELLRFVAKNARSIFLKWIINLTFTFEIELYDTFLPKYLYVALWVNNLD